MASLWPCIAAFTQIGLGRAPIAPEFDASAFMEAAWSALTDGTAGNAAIGLMVMAEDGVSDIDAPVASCFKRWSLPRRTEYNWPCLSERTQLE